MKSMTLVYDINASPEEVFRALVEPTLIEEWSGSSAQMEAKAGAEFSLWEGSIYGKNIAVIPNQKLVQEWFEGDWETASIATFTLVEKNGGTQLTLHHENIPDQSYEAIREGWDIYYLEPLKDLVEEMQENGANY